MTARETLARVDHLLHAANEAGSDYDYLTFEAQAIPPSDFRDTLGYWLSELQDGLAELSKDLSTLLPRYVRYERPDAVAISRAALACPPQQRGE